MDDKLVAAYVLFGIGGVILLCGVVWATCLFLRRRHAARKSRDSPDTFKVIYRHPAVSTSSHVTGTVVAPEMVKVTPTSSVPVYTTAPRGVARSEAAYSYTSKSIPNGTVLVGRATSVDRVNTGAHHSGGNWQQGYRYRLPSEPTGNGRVAVPIEVPLKRKDKTRMVRAYVPTYGTSAAGTSGGGAARAKQVYMYGSVPNLMAKSVPSTTAAAQGTKQPVLLYDKSKRYYVMNSIPQERQAHVRRWLRQEKFHSQTDEERPPSRSSSAPDDLDLDGVDADMYALHLKWGPQARSRLEEKSRSAYALDVNNQTLPVYQVHGKYQKSNMSTKTM